VSGPFSRLGAHAIRASMLADRALTYFDRLRSLVVSALASDGVLEAYNDMAYGATAVYDASAPQFRDQLFNWEVEMVRTFPGPPGSVLVGGAGGGREAFELSARGYAVTAFEPSRVLAQSMRDRAAATGAAVRVLVGRYENLPVLRTLDGETIDLSTSPPFAAALFGWTSYSHIRRSADRAAALAGLARLADGRVYASFFKARADKTTTHALSAWTSRRGWRRDGDRFSPNIGFFHESAISEIDEEIAAAGLVRVGLSENDGDGYWPWFAAARPEVAAREPARG